MTKPRRFERRRLERARSKGVMCPPAGIDPGISAAHRRRRDASSKVIKVRRRGRRHAARRAGPDLWIIESEDRAGRHFLDQIVK
jgi:hypothetical protein